MKKFKIGIIGSPSIGSSVIKYATERGIELIQKEDAKIESPENVKYFDPKMLANNLKPHTHYAPEEGSKFIPNRKRR